MRTRYAHQVTLLVLDSLLKRGLRKQWNQEDSWGLGSWQLLEEKVQHSNSGYSYTSTNRSYSCSSGHIGERKLELMVTNPQRTLVPLVLCSRSPELCQVDTNLYPRPGRSTRQHQGRVWEGTLDNNLKQSPVLILTNRSSTRASQQKGERSWWHYWSHREPWYAGTLDHDWPRNQPCRWGVHCWEQLRWCWRAPSPWGRICISASIYTPYQRSDGGVAEQWKSFWGAQWSLWLH